MELNSVSSAADVPLEPSPELSPGTQHLALTVTAPTATPISPAGTGVVTPTGNPGDFDLPGLDFIDNTWNYWRHDGPRFLGDVWSWYDKDIGGFRQRVNQMLGLPADTDARAWIKFTVETTIPFLGHGGHKVFASYNGSTIPVARLHNSISTDLTKPLYMEPEPADLEKDVAEVLQKLHDRFPKRAVGESDQQYDNRVRKYLKWIIALARTKLMNESDQTYFKAVIKFLAEIGLSDLAAELAKEFATTLTQLNLSPK